MTAAKDRVDAKSLAHMDLEPVWQMMDDLWGGTRAMQRAGKAYLPQWPDEEEEAYLRRVARSVLEPALKDTVNKLAAKPFAKPVTLPDAGLAEPLASIEKDVDRRDMKLTRFAQERFRVGLRYGVLAAIVEFPRVGEGLTLGAEQAGNVRPYFVGLKPQEILGGIERETDTGEKVLAQLRLLEERIEKDGEFGERCVRYVRVWNAPNGEELGTWELHREKSNAATGTTEFVLEDSGTHSYPGIPLVIKFLGEQTGPLTCEVPFEQMAHINVAHWRSDSDQRNNLNFFRLGLLAATGFRAEEITGVEGDTEVSGFTIAPNAFLHSSQPDAKVAYAEPTCEGIKAGERDLVDLSDRMRKLGDQPTQKKSGNDTVIGVASDENNNTCQLKQWVELHSDFLTECYRVAGRWVKQELPEDFRANVYNDFAVNLKFDEESGLLRELNLSGKLSDKTLLSELQRRNVFDETFDVEEEIQRIADQPPPLGLVAIGDPLDGDPEGDE